MYGRERAEEEKGKDKEGGKTNEMGMEDIERDRERERERERGLRDTKRHTEIEREREKEREREDREGALTGQPLILQRKPQTSDQPL